MELVTRQIPALYGGVSQQPATLRLPSQAEVQVNAYGTVQEGLRKRPPFEHVARLHDGQLRGAFLHTINRDATERYLVVVTDGDLKVYDIEGNEKPVNFPLGREYLSTGGAPAASSFAIVTIADYSFVVNKTKICATKSAPTGQPAEYSSWYFPPTWGSSAQAPTYYYNPAQGVYRGVKQTFNDLPKTTDNPPPAEGDVWKIAGYDQNSFGAYYVVRRGGVWQETHAPGQSITLDPATMPHALVNNGDGTFTFTSFPWKARKVGDNESNPAPTFVGRRIKDVVYYKNRLGFVADENVILSAAGDYGNFFRTTVTDLLDSDPVDVAVSSTKVSILEYAVPFNNGLMLFADQSQFRLNSGDLLTPRSVSIDTATEFPASTRCRPVGIGSLVYFPVESGDYTRIREYFVDADMLINDAADVTAHVPQFLPKGISRLAGNANEDVLFAISDETPNRIYVYKFFWGNEGKVQSAWSYWELAETDTVLSIETLENTLYAVIQRPDGVYLEKCDVQSGATTGDLGHQVLLDRLRPIVGVYDPASDTTTFSLVPCPLAESDRSKLRIVRGSAFGGQALSLIDPATYRFPNLYEVVVPGDHSAGVCWVGLKYEMRYTFSEQFLVVGDRPVTTGRLMLRTFVVYFTNTAYFKTEVAPYGIDPLVETIIPAQLSEFTGKTIGDAALMLNTPVFATGKYAFQIYGDSRVAKVSLVNDSHVQSIFQSAEWEALYHNRARPLA